MVADRDGADFGLGPVPYYTFGLGRTLTLAGVRTVNGKDWYRLGSEIILASQQRDGSWYRGDASQTDVLETCWHLLFLTQATVRELPR